MPNGFCIGLGLDSAGNRRLVDVLGPGATIDEVGGTIVTHVSDGRGTLRRDRIGDGVQVTFGCRAATSNPVGDHDVLLDGTDDAVAALVSDDGVTVASGHGHHRLFHTVLDGGGVVIGSGLHPVAAMRGDRLRVDRRLEDFALGFGFHPEDHTPYEAVRSLPGGRRFHVRRAGLAAAGVTDATRPSPGEVPQSFDKAVDRLHDLFMATVERQAGPPRRHAVLLGGLDSALVAMGLRRLGHDVTTYTFGFGDARYEQRNARWLADRIGADHRVVDITAGAVMAHLRDFAVHYPDISAQPHYMIHTMIASERIAADGHSGVFSGDGCDSIFLGYPTVSARADLARRLAAVPRPVARGLRRLLAGRHVADRLGHVGRMARGVLGNIDLEMPARGHLPTRYIDEYELRRLRLGPSPVAAETVDDIRRRLAEPVAHLDPLRLAFHGNALNRQSQAKVDGAVRATGVAHFSPYRDPVLRAYVDELPTEFLRAPGRPARDAGKAVLVEMIRRYELLPDEIIEMPKQSPSDSPIDHWYAGPLRTEVHDLLAHLPFEVDHAAIDAILRHTLAERWYRERVSISHHAFQVIGLLCTYASFGLVAGS